MGLPWYVPDIRGDSSQSIVNYPIIILGIWVRFPRGGDGSPFDIHTFNNILYIFINLNNLILNSFKSLVIN